MRLLAATALLCLSAQAGAEELCSAGEASGGRLVVTLTVSKQDKSPPRVTYMHVGATGADSDYKLSVWYDPSDAGIGTPVMTGVEIRMPVPDPERAEPERIEWRVGSGAWFNPGYWGNPGRSGADPKQIRGSVHYTIAQSQVHPYRIELLDTFAPGVRWEFRRLDREGRVIGSGAVNYPPSQVVDALYRRARAQGIAGLRPCGSDGPPMIALPAPRPMRIGPPAGPPGPRDPGELDALACRFFRNEEKLALERKRDAGDPIHIVAQRVDCAARSVTRVLEVRSLRKSERREVGMALQSMTDKLWCSTVLFRELLKRGWTLGAEIRAPRNPTPISATTRKCAEPR